jgi:hypothetical protein
MLRAPVSTQPLQGRQRVRTILHSLLSSISLIHSPLLNVSIHWSNILPIGRAPQGQSPAARGILMRAMKRPIVGLRPSWGPQ